MASKLLERVQIVPVMLPVDLNDGATTGDYVSLKNYERCCAVLVAGDGTAGSDVSVAFYQATDVSGTSAKVLNALETGRIYTKEGTSALTAVAQWTKETQATADEQWAPTDSGEQVLLWAFEIKADDLDVDNGFDCIRMDISDPGAAKIGAALYILYDAKYPVAPELMLSAIAD